MKVGDRIKTKRSGWVTVVSLGYDYLSAKCKFDNTGYILSGIPRCQLKNGDVKDPYARLTKGVGYIGTPEKRFPHKHKKAAKVWNNILLHCDRAGYSIANEWKNLSNFVKWYESNYTEEFDTLLKDARSSIYCKQTCRMVTKKESLMQGQKMKMSYRKVMDSNGNTYSFENASKFCRDNGLDRKLFSHLLNGKVKQHRGFVCIQ